MSPVRLALLVCGHVTPPISDVHGDMSQMYIRLLSKSLAQTNPEIMYTLDSYDVVSKMIYPPDDIHYDGLLISGSRHSAYEDVEWINKLIAYVKHILVEKPALKLFGMCFGHQIIARALGSACVRNNVWEVGMTSIQLTPIGSALFGANTLDIQQVHRDHVPTCPPGAHVLAWNDATPNHGMVIFDPISAHYVDADAPRVDPRSIRVLTIQGHPEFTAPFVSTVLDKSVEVLGTHVDRDGRMQTGNTPGKSDPDGLAYDGIKIGKAIWSVLGVGRSRTHGVPRHIYRARL